MKEGLGFESICNWWSISLKPTAVCLFVFVAMCWWIIKPARRFNCQHLADTWFFFAAICRMAVVNKSMKMKTCGCETALISSVMLLRRCKVLLFSGKQISAGVSNNNVQTFSYVLLAVQFTVGGFFLQQVVYNIFSPFFFFIGFDDQGSLLVIMMIWLYSKQMVDIIRGIKAMQAIMWCP